MLYFRFLYAGGVEAEFSKLYRCRVSAVYGPVHQNYRHVCAVKYLTGMENVRSVVVFAGRAYTSPFVHHQVVRLKNLERVLRTRPEGFAYVDDRELERAWHVLQQASIANTGRGREHIDKLRQRFS